MKSIVCDSPFDVAFWLLDRALEDDEYLQPQKLQRIMYLSQAYYAAATGGDRLMPCIFVTSIFGPIEPTTFRAFEFGRPNVQVHPIPESPKHFLDSVWRRFGAHTVDYLDRMIAEHPPYKEAAAVGDRTEISIESMVAYYGRRRSRSTDDPESRAERLAAPALDSVIRPRVMRSHKGRPVNVHSWIPTKRLGGDEEGG